MSSGDLLKHKWIHGKGDIKHQCPVCDKVINGAKTTSTMCGKDLNVYLCLGIPKIYERYG